MSASFTPVEWLHHWRSAALLWGTEKREHIFLQFHNAQTLESQCGKFALAPAGLEDERDLEWHGSMFGGWRGALSMVGLISLYPVWRAADGLDLHQLSTFLQLPVTVQSKAGLSAHGLPGRTSVPLHPPCALNIHLTLPCLKSPHLSSPAWPLGFSYKKMKGSLGVVEQG